MNTDESPRSLPHALRRLPGVAGMMLAMLAGCSDEEGSPRGESGPPEVVVAEPVRRTITEYLTYNGSLESSEIVRVRARVPGFLEEVRFEPSAIVDRGQVLFVIERRPYEVEVARRRAELTEAEASQRLAEARLARAESAFEQQAVTEIELLEYRAQVMRSEAVVASAQAALDRAELDLSYTQVRSPIAGRIDEALVDAGNLVGEGEATLLATVRRLSPIYAYFDASEAIALRYIERGRTGNVPGEEVVPVHLGLMDTEGYPYEGTLGFVDNQIDPNTGTITVRAVFENPDQRLFPGLYARLRVPFEEIEGAILVEENALGRDLAGDYVLVVGDGDTVERRGVAVGDRYDPDLVHIPEGLSAGERYIVRGLLRARPGRSVTPLTQSEWETRQDRGRTPGRGGGSGSGPDSGEDDAGAGGGMGGGG